MRMMALYYFANSLGLLVAGTGNKVEDFGIGFFTRGGDSVVDLSPIADLMKSEVWSLGEYMGVNSEIIRATPSDGLWTPKEGETDVSDEDQIKASYPELEWAMNVYETGVLPEEESLTPRDKEVLDIYLRWNNKNQFKMIDVPICEVKDLR
jgi:NAD+ synthase